MIDRISTAIAIPLLAATLAACGDSSASSASSAPDTQRTTCLLVGCGDTLVVKLEGILSPSAPPLPLIFSLCIDDKPCKQFWVGSSPKGPACTIQDPTSIYSEDCWIYDEDVTANVSLGPEYAFDGAPLAAHLRVTTQDGTEVFNSEAPGKLHMFQPNGPKCEPTCYQGGITFVWQGDGT